MSTAASRPGSTRPDVFNWFEEIRKRVKELRPKVVVLGFGANDDKAYMTGLPEGVSIDAFGGSVWRREYARRVGGLMDVINRAGGFVVWIGLPQTRSPEQTQRFDVVNAVAQKEAREARGPRRVHRHVHDVRRATTAATRSSCRTARGRLRKVRADDGVHFEREGGDMIAREVLKAMNRAVRPHELAQEEGEELSGRAPGPAQPVTRARCRMRLSTSSAATL